MTDAPPGSPRPASWQRQMLVHLTEDGWRAALRQPWTGEIRPCLEHWAERDLPLVVARQNLDNAKSALATPAGTLLLGLAAPQCWGRRRVALRVASGHLTMRPHSGGSLGDSTARPDTPDADLPTRTDRASGVARRGPNASPCGREPRLLPSRWPSLAAVVAGLPAAPAAWLALPAQLHRVGLCARVYGSHGWQHLTGLAYCHGASDLDLLIPVADHATASRAATLLAAIDDEAGLLDGELCFPDGRAVAWREWRRWSQGATRVVLFKSLHGAALAEPGETPCPNPA